MIRHLRILLCSFLVLGGCETDEAPDIDPLSSLKLYVFDCGKMQFESLEMFSIADDETAVRELVDPCFVVEHSNGRLLWDGGLPSATAETDGWQPFVEGVLRRLDRTMADQLTEIGMSMNSFDYVAFSHMHPDHVGVANELDGATMLIQKAEYVAAFADPVTVPFFDPSLYEKLKTAEHVIIEGDYDVFGDGRVRILSAPGHTPGHQVLFIDLVNTGPIVLSGDLYIFPIGRTDRRVPAFNFDTDATLESMDRVEAFLAETGAKLWIQHDLAWFEQLKKSPASYD